MVGTSLNRDIYVMYMNPPMTVKVKISQNVDILVKVYLVHFKSQTLSNLMCSKYIYRSKWVDHFWWVKALSCIIEGGQNDSKNQSKMPLWAHLCHQSKQAVDCFDHYSNLPLKFSYSRRVRQPTSEIFS